MQADQIPAELVEAAARAWWEHDAEGMAAWCDQMGVESDPTWDEISDADRDHVRQSIGAPVVAAVWGEIQARALEAEADRTHDFSDAHSVHDDKTQYLLRKQAAALRTPTKGAGGGS